MNLESSAVVKYGAVVTTVDVSNKVIEVALKTGETRRMTLATYPAFFVWPQVGDQVMVRCENGQWNLDGFFDTQGIYQTVSPGDAVVASSTNTLHVVGGDSDWTLTPTGWPLNTTAGGDLTGNYPNPTIKRNILSTLPSNPTDGQEVLLAQTNAGDTVVWHLRYNAGASSQYKWEFLGGAPLYSQDPNDRTYGPNFSSTGLNYTPSVTLDRAGEYSLRFGAMTLGNGGTYNGVSDIELGVWDYNNTGTNYSYPIYNTVVGVYNGAGVSAEAVFTATAGAVPAMYCSQATTTNSVRIYTPWLSVLPRRLA